MKFESEARSRAFSRLWLEPSVRSEPFAKRLKPRSEKAGKPA
jgi:hypothetical protein